MRLTKAAREFNVGVNTITDFLNKKGFKDDFSPNSKLTPDMVSLLVAEYQSEKDVKEKAHERVLATDRTPVSLNQTEVEEVEVEEESSGNDFIIHDNSLKGSSTKSTPSPKKNTPEEIVEPIPTKQEEAPKAKPVVAEEIPVVETPKVEENPAPVIETPVVEKVKEEPVQQVKEKTVPPKAEEIKESTTPVEDKAPKAISPKADVPIIKEEKPVVAEKTVLNEPKPTPVESDQGGHHPKVVDKIDLDNTNWSTRPKPKSKEEKRQEKANKGEQRKQSTEKAIAHSKAIKAKEDEAKAVEAEKVKAQASAKPEAPEIETIRAKAEKLTGPKVLRTIVLEPKREKKKLPEASSSDSKNRKKKKRTRIKKPVDPNSTTAKQGTGAGNRPGQAGQGGGQGQKPGDRNAQSNRRKGKKPNTRTPLVKKVEPTEEEIRKQIKDTLARLAPAGKSKASKHRRNKRDHVHKLAEEEMQKEIEELKVIKVAEYVTANDLSNMIDVPVTKIIATCMGIGLFVSINQRLDAETLLLVAEEFGFQVEFVGVEASESIKTDEEDFSEDDLEDRAPIVTVMGHVDHGKTKLLDYVRSANVVAGEAGGITQHIGAYEVITKDGRSVTFLDTPGHEAFTAMRARGAKVTDIAIIVIAADDRVMPQTKEAINHAQAAGIPIVFAINKMDKPGANADQVKNELSQMNILVEDWGGKFQSQEISALKGDGVEDLLEKVLLEADMLELKATPKRKAVGSVIEASLDKGRGYVTKILVQDGTLRVGDMVLAGSSYGKVKAMFNEYNQNIKEAGPATPVLMLGLNNAPQAGDNIIVLADEREVKVIATKREQLQREQSIRTQKHITLDEIGRRLAIGDFKELNVIVKADVDGSVEALSDSLIKLSTSEVQLNVIHKSVGQISESDVLLASASDAIIVGFQVRPNMQARKLADTEGIQIKQYSIIYQAIEELKLALEGMLAPQEEEKIVANVEVREVFVITKVGTIAGCKVLDGKITRNTPIRLIRDGVVIYTGKLGSLKRFKDDVKEVVSGYECGLNIEKFNDIKVGDIVEGYEIVQTARTL
ncbi:MULTISPECIES: translation initiation factor IF-2 [unclassified Lentimicrobium]|uniref:translation initiation factor IF-2 n=1 Tax=unclassified Lentimicrobium TaxID=2677434 RepID=UPI001557A009|nr:MULTISPECIES: translation initiation factor IF-2 [unclassified Lentimicrobium]NPD47819.1 translation initiation factor IF-2 [Lentimicrobium sp. S6]NPD86075.1 translation initiation factor IF-2 [Lentimicrobium sp. L6]